MSRGKTAALVVGCLLAVIGIVLIAATALLGWAYTTQRDDDGYFTASRQHLETSTPALHSENIDLGRAEAPDAWPFGDGDLVRVRLQASASEARLFLGIARTEDLDRYLSGTAHDEVTDIDFRDRDVTYRRVEGDATISPPQEQTFWAAQASSTGVQTLEWSVRSGDWSIVLMNADGSPGVSSDVTAGVRVRYLAQVLLGLGIGAAATLLGAIALIVAAVHGTTSRTPSEAAVADGAWTVEEAGTPVRLEGHLDHRLNRGLWLVKWFLAIPHFVVLIVLWIAFVALTVVAGFTILFTGRYPRRIFDFNTGVLRWSWRVQFYATSAIGTDRYPPFSLGHAEGYPASVDVAYPERLSRGLVLVKWWLLAVPHYAVIAVFQGGVGWFGNDRYRLGPGGLIGIVTLIAGFGLLFTGRYPVGLFRFVMGMNRWVYRVIAYAALMTDRYPPWRFDDGPSEPGPSVPRGPDGEPAASPISTAVSPGRGEA